MNQLKISTQLIVLFAGTLILTIVMLTVLSIFQTRAIIQEGLTTRGRTLAESAANFVVKPMYVGDVGGVRQVMGTVVGENGFDTAIIFEPSGRIQTSQSSAKDQSVTTTPADAAFVGEVIAAGQTRVRAQGDFIDVGSPIVANGQALGVFIGRTATVQINAEVVRFIPQAVVAGLGAALLGSLLALVIARRVARPLGELADAAAAVGQGKLDAPLVARRGGEVGALAAAFAQMVASLRLAREQVAEQQRTLEQRVAERTAELELTLADLRESTSARDQLSATVRDLTSPIVPVMDGILVMPLIGMIDEQRAEIMTASLLKAVEQRRASVVILDVTGVPLVDTSVATVLIRAAESVRLLGARTVLVGLRPEVAQTIVGLGVDLSALITRADLQSGVAYATHVRGARRTPAG